MQFSGRCLRTAARARSSSPSASRFRPRPSQDAYARGRGEGRHSGLPRRAFHRQALGLTMTVIVHVGLRSQNEEACLKSFRGGGREGSLRRVLPPDVGRGRLPRHRHGTRPCRFRAHTQGEVAASWRRSPEIELRAAGRCRQGAASVMPATVAKWLTAGKSVQDRRKDVPAHGTICIGDHRLEHRQACDLRLRAMHGLRRSVSSPTRFCCLGRFYLPAHGASCSWPFSARSWHCNRHSPVHPMPLPIPRATPEAPASRRPWRKPSPVAGVRRQGDGIAALGEVERPSAEFCSSAVAHGHRLEAPAPLIISEPNSAHTARAFSILRGAKGPMAMAGT